MKTSLIILTFALIFTCQSFGQDNNESIIPELKVKEQKKESKLKIDSTYINFYVLNYQDTFYFTNYSTVLQCNFLQSLDKSHNKCMIYINEQLGNGKIEIVFNNNSGKSTSTFYGTISSGLYIEGTYMVKSFEGKPILTGQYQNNWKHGFWTSYYSNGSVQSINKFIEGVDDPVKTWKFNESGELIDFTDEEAEIINLMKENND